MDELMRTRLTELRAEFEANQEALHQLELRVALLRERTLMVRGAIQVLEELTAPRDTSPSSNGRQPSAVA